MVFGSSFSIKVISLLIFFKISPAVSPYPLFKFSKTKLKIKPYLAPAFLRWAISKFVKKSALTIRAVLSSLYTFKRLLSKIILFSEFETSYNTW